MTGFPCIQLENLTVEIDNHKIVTEISLSVSQGEKVAILGHSGSGKTTLLRAIAGLEEHLTAGTLKLDGKNAVGAGYAVIPPHARKIAMLFQDLALWPHMNVEEHLRFPIRGHKLSKEEIDRRVENTIKMVELNGREKSKPGSLSGGEQQRLALARAVIGKPSRLLLDEPFSSLDLPLKKSMIELLMNLHKENNFTLLHVTHDPVEAAHIADRIVAIDSGSIVWSGAPRELMQAKHIALAPLIRAAQWWG